VNDKVGTLSISEFTTNANGVVIPDGVTGDLVDFDVTVLSGVDGAVIKLNASRGHHFTDVNGGAATLAPAPNNLPYDAATDDRLLVVRPHAPHVPIALASDVGSQAGPGNFVSVLIIRLLTSRWSSVNPPIPMATHLSRLADGNSMKSTLASVADFASLNHVRARTSRGPVSNVLWQMFSRDRTDLRISGLGAEGE
jgi:hypothetical protein